MDTRTSNAPGFGSSSLRRVHAELLAIMATPPWATPLPFAGLFKHSMSSPAPLARSRTSLSREAPSASQVSVTTPKVISSSSKQSIRESILGQRERALVLMKLIGVHLFFSSLSVALSFVESELAGTSSNSSRIVSSHPSNRHPPEGSSKMESSKPSNWHMVEPLSERVSPPSSSSCRFPLSSLAYGSVRVWRARASASAHTRSYMYMHADTS